MPSIALALQWMPTATMQQLTQAKTKAVALNLHVHGEECKDAERLHTFWRVLTLVMVRMTQGRSSVHHLRAASSSPTT